MSQQAREVFATEYDKAAEAFRNQVLCAADGIASCLRPIISAEFEIQIKSLQNQNSSLQVHVDTLTQELAEHRDEVRRLRQQLDRISQRYCIAREATRDTSLVAVAFRSWMKETQVERRVRRAERLFTNRKRRSDLRRAFYAFKLGALLEAKDHASTEIASLNERLSTMQDLEEENSTLRVALRESQESKILLEATQKDDDERIKMAVLHSIHALGQAAGVLQDLPPVPQLSPALPLPQAQAEPTPPRKDYSQRVNSNSPVSGVALAEPLDFEPCSVVMPTVYRVPSTPPDDRPDEQRDQQAYHPNTTIAEEERARNIVHAQELIPHPKPIAWTHSELMQTPHDSCQQRPQRVNLADKPTSELTAAEAIALYRSNEPKGKFVNVGAAIMRDIDYLSDTRPPRKQYSVRAEATRPQRIPPLFEQAALQQVDHQPLHIRTEHSIDSVDGRPIVVRRVCP